MSELKARAVNTKVVMPVKDDRIFCLHVSGAAFRAVKHVRWCTAQLKIEPMVNALKSLRDEYGKKFLC